MALIPLALSLLLPLAGPAVSAGAFDVPVPAIGPSGRIEQPLTDYHLISRPETPAPPPAAEPGRDDSSLRSPRQLSVWVSEPAEEGSAWNILKWSYRDRTRAAARAYLGRLCLRGGWASAEVEDMACEERQVGISSLKWECDIYSSCSKPVRGDFSRISVNGETWESKSELLERVRARYDRICKRQGRSGVLIHDEACNRQETLSGSHRWSCDFTLGCTD